MALKKTQHHKLRKFYGVLWVKSLQDTIASTLYNRYLLPIESLESTCNAYGEREIGIE